MQPWSQPLLWKTVSGAVACDPYFGNVVLLMGYEGTNGSTGAPGMTDESPAAHGTALVSGAQISTAQEKFGTSSLFPGVTGYIDFPTSNDWYLSSANSSQFTIEMWIYVTNLTGGGYLINRGQSGQENYLITYSAGGEFTFGLSTDGITANYQYINTSGAALTANTWAHVAVDKDATGKIRIYKNGTMYGNSTPANSTFYSGSAQSLYIGIRPGSNSITGYIDDLRITKGIARYASDGGVATTWNPSDKGTSVTLSGGNLTATASATGDMAVRATTSHATGKYYFEVTVGATYTGGDTGPGIMTLAAARDTFGQNATGGVITYPSGAIYYNGSPAPGSPNIGAPGTGQIIGIAVDLVNMKVWMRLQAGTWKGSSAGPDDPATNTGGLSISTVFGSAAAYPVQAFGPSASGSTSTVNFSGSFVNGPPSGFSSWDVPAFTVPTAAFPRTVCAATTNAAYAFLSWSSSGNQITANFGATAFNQAVPSGFASWGASSVTWNPSDKSASVTLSNGNLTAVPTAGAVYVRDTSFQNPGAGKFYFEYHLDLANSGSTNSYGIGTSAAAPGSTNLTCVCNPLTGGIFYNGTVPSGSPSLGALANGTYLCCAVDLVNKRMWFRANGGNWNGNATYNPATNVGGVDISSVFT